MWQALLHLLLPLHLHHLAHLLEHFHQDVHNGSDSEHSTQASQIYCYHKNDGFSPNTQLLLRPILEDQVPRL